MASSFSVSSQVSQKYDVFLNFRGENVRFNFLSYLIAALNQASLNIFVDYKLKRGEYIKSALMDAIQGSKVSLTIFSEGYASSAWSLDELVKIMECRENPMLRQKVIPVFYHVTASDVRNQSGVFAEDFAKHESDCGSRGKVPLWRAAMSAAGCLSGRSVKKTSPELDVMMQIVNDVLEILGRNDPISNTGDNISKRTFSSASIHAELHICLYNQKEVSSEKLKDCPKTQQQQGNGSIWTISKRQGLHVKELNTVLKSIEVQSGGKPSKSHYNQSETSSSHPSPPISYRSGTTIRKMAATTAPTKSTMTNSSFGSGDGNNMNGVNSQGLESTAVPTSSVAQVGLPMSSGRFASGDGNNTNVSGLGGTTVPYSYVSRQGMPMATTPMSAPGFGGEPRDGKLAQLADVDKASSLVSLGKSGLETGISLNELGLEMGVSLNRMSLETGFSLSNSSLETDISLRKLGLEAGVSLRKLDLETDISLRKFDPETGISLRKLSSDTGVSLRKSGPETGVSIRKLDNETNVSLRKLDPKNSVSIRKLDPKIGVSLRKLSPKTGVFIRKLDPETGVSLRKSGPEINVSVRKLDPKTSVSIRKLDPDTGVSLRKSDPETGVSLRKSSPDNGVSLRKLDPKTGVSMRKLVPETGVSLRKLVPETGVSMRKLGLETGVSIRKLDPETGVL